MAASVQRKLKRRLQLPIPKSRPRLKSIRDKRSDTSGKQQYLSDRFLRLSRFGKDDADVFSLRSSLFTQICNKFNSLGIKVYFQRIYILAKNNEDEQANGQNENYIKEFHAQMSKIFEVCEKKKISAQHVNGFLLSMDNYSILAVEGPDHMLGVFMVAFVELQKVYWSAAKVFLVQNQLEKGVFDGFKLCTSNAINTNDKFNPSTSKEFDLMVYQHFKIVEKVENLTELLAMQLRGKFDGHMIHILPADPYNKVVPEVQRIDLVLNSHDFYMDVEQFADTYNYVPNIEDDDMVCWPMANNYTPYGIYGRSIYDVNLIFSDYDKEPIVDKEAVGRRQKILSDITEVAAVVETPKAAETPEF